VSDHSAVNHRTQVVLHVLGNAPALSYFIRQSVGEALTPPHLVPVRGSEAKSSGPEAAAPAEDKKDVVTPSSERELIIKQNIQFLGAMLAESEELILTRPGHEALWCHRRSLLEILLEKVGQATLAASSSSSSAGASASAGSGNTAALAGVVHSTVEQFASFTLSAEKLAPEPEPIAIGVAIGAGSGAVSGSRGSLAPPPLQPTSALYSEDALGWVVARGYGAGSGCGSGSSSGSEAECSVENTMENADSSDSIGAKNSTGNTDIKDCGSGRGFAQWWRQFVRQEARLVAHCAEEGNSAWGGPQQGALAARYAAFVADRVRAKLLLLPVQV
jgi:hypothetical protein